MLHILDRSRRGPVRSTSESIEEAGGSCDPEAPAAKLIHSSRSAGADLHFIQ